MTDRQGGRSCTVRPSARPHRPTGLHEPATWPDVVLALIVVLAGLAIIVAPAPGPIDGRHVLAVTALVALIARTTRAARR